MLLTHFLQTPTPTLDKIPGPVDARFLSAVGLGFGTCIGRTQLFPTSALDKYRFPILGIFCFSAVFGDSLHTPRDWCEISGLEERLL